MTEFRSRRSNLAVPGSNPRFLEKAKGLPADQVFLDLEDACAPLAKPGARKNIVAALVADVPLTGFSTRDWWLIAAITCCAQLLGHTLLNLVLSTVGPTVVGLAILLEVPGALLVALVLLHQAPPLLALPGVVLVVAGVALVIRAGRPATLVEPAT